MDVVGICKEVEVLYTPFIISTTAVFWFTLLTTRTVALFRLFFHLSIFNHNEIILSTASVLCYSLHTHTFIHYFTFTEHVNTEFFTCVPVNGSCEKNSLFPPHVFRSEVAAVEGIGETSVLSVRGKVGWGERWQLPSGLRCISPLLHLAGFLYQCLQFAKLFHQSFLHTFLQQPALALTLWVFRVGHRLQSSAQVLQPGHVR